MKNKKVFLIALLLIAILSGCIGEKSNIVRVTPTEEKPNIVQITPTEEKSKVTPITDAKEEIEVTATNVTIENRQMLVNGKPFTIEGVGYSPVPIGEDPDISQSHGDYFTNNYKYIYNRDLPLLRKMGTNTIRLWYWNNTADHTDFLNKAYNNGKDPIYVIVPFWIGHKTDMSSSEVRDKLKSDFREMVAKNKDHPAILMWVIGNELNAIGDDKLDDVFSLVDEMAEEAHLEDNSHPVTTTLVDRDLTNTIKTYDPNMTNLDIWSVQLYRGKYFGNFFREYQNVSSKPLAILEYGIDAYDDINRAEHEKIQAEYASYLWNQIKKNSEITVGGTITAYSDVWWKGKWGRSKSNCPDRNASFHSVCGYPVQSHPDGYVNEEWWGIMRTKNNGTSPDIMEPREIYYTLMKLWTNQS